MSRRVLTLDSAERAMVAQLADGDLPTLASVRRKTGGSPNTAQVVVPEAAQRIAEKVRRYDEMMANGGRTS